MFDRFFMRCTIDSLYLVSLVFQIFAIYIEPQIHHVVKIFPIRRQNEQQIFEVFVLWLSQ